MKKEKTILIITLFILICIIIGLTMYLINQNKYIKTISYTEIKEKIENKDTFILYIKKDKCSACENFTPKFQSVLKENNITVYALNLSDLKEKENDELDTIITGIDATPTVIFYEKGIDIGARFVGSREKEYIKSKLTDLGYIK